LRPWRRRKRKIRARQGAEVYKIAQKIFAQTPAPEKIAVVWLDMTTPEALTTALTALMAAGHNDWYFPPLGEPDGSERKRARGPLRQRTASSTSAV